jgi:hypothetical protein
MGASNVQKLPQDRETRPPEDGREGKALSLRQVPQTKPETGQVARTLVLPKVPRRTGGHDSMTILFLHGWTSVPSGVKPHFISSMRTLPGHRYRSWHHLCSGRRIHRRGQAAPRSAGP